MSEQPQTMDDRAWLRHVFQQYEGQLVRYTARLLEDADRARDVVQDAFLKLCRQPRAQVERQVRSWLFTVCRNRAMDILKKENRMRAWSDERAERCESGDPSPGTAWEQRESAGQAIRLLAELPGNQQEVIRLKVQDGLSYREISEVTGLSVSNVGFLLHKGLKAIRERLLLSGAV